MVTEIPKKIAYERGTVERGILLNNVTVTTTSRDVQCAGARKVTFRVKRTNHSSGSSAFSVEATLNGDDFFTYNFLIDHVTNANTENLTRVAGKTLNSNSEAVFSMDLANMGVLAFRLKVVETTDGTHYGEYLLEN
jgi:hypothetical protein